MSVPRIGRWLAIVVAVVVAAVAFVAVARHQADPEGRPVKASSVDAGFARDMSVHHAQAVQMAAYTQDHAPTAEVKALAALIAPQQQLEIGQMLGWLEAWGLQRTSSQPAMAWMGSKGHDHHHAAGGATGSLMPGMATPAELDDLVNLQGAELEVRFLQLMIRHHQGGVPMAKVAAQRASHRFVRDSAGQMVVSQTGEIDRMRQLLDERGGAPLPAP